MNFIEYKGIFLAFFYIKLYPYYNLYGRDTMCMERIECNAKT